MNRWSAIFTRLKPFLLPFADFIFPPLCYGCDQEIPAGLICDACRLLLFTSELDVCAVCGRPCLPDQRVCGGCEPPLALSRIRAIGVYGAPFLGLVYALKYSAKTALVPVLGDALALLVQQDTQLRSADGICAVPLHPARLRERGYNQSYLLAEAVSRATGISLIDPLVRVRNTGTQTRQRDEKERFENVRGVFALRVDIKIAGQRLILVDDVMTSGATLSSAAGELRRAGATEVMGLVVAAGVGSSVRQRGYPAKRRSPGGGRVLPRRHGAG